jgi:hypothetical protein
VSNYPIIDGIIKRPISNDEIGQVKGGNAEDGAGVEREAPDPTHV